MGRTACIFIDIGRTGEQIHNVMIEHGCTVKQLQEKLRLSCPQPVYRWIHGYTLPSVDHLYRMSRIFQVHMEELLVEAGGKVADKTADEME